MATITDDYVLVGSSGDGFDCEDSGDWTIGGDAAKSDNTADYVEGSQCLGLQGKAGDDNYWYNDLSSDSRFKIVEKDLGIWFMYVKGKGANFLVQDSTAIVVRLYFGGTDKYADYRMTDTGDLELGFGWQMLMCSGKNMNGGSVGGGHNDGSDWNEDIHRFELRLNFANDTTVDLGLDACFIGTEVQVESGTSGDPVTMDDLYMYTGKDREGFPIGVVDVTKKLVNIQCGITIDGGYLVAENTYLLFNQGSAEVKHNIHVVDGTFRIGEIVNGVDGDYSMNGCQIVKPAGAKANVYVDAGANLEVYNSKFYRWEDIHLNGTVKLNGVDFDTNETVYFEGTGVEFNDISVHNNTAVDRDNAVMFTANPTTGDILKMYRCVDGVYFSADVTISNVDITDTTGYDVGVYDGNDVSLVSSSYSDMRRL